MAGLSVAALGTGVVAIWPTPEWCPRCEDRVCRVQRLVWTVSGLRSVAERWCACPAAACLLD